MKITRVEATWLQVPIAPAQQHSSDFGRATTFTGVPAAKPAMQRVPQSIAPGTVVTMPPALVVTLNVN